LFFVDGFVLICIVLNPFLEILHHSFLSKANIVWAVDLKIVSMNIKSLKLCKPFMIP